MQGFRDYRFIKMLTTKAGTFIFHSGKRLDFGKGYDGVRRALNYIDIQRFLAKVDGRAIGCAGTSIYPVKTLVPKTIIKTVKYITLLEEVV